jgi:hypothetical protein
MGTLDITPVRALIDEAVSLSPDRAKSSACLIWRAWPHGCRSAQHRASTGVTDAAQAAMKTGRRRA